MRTYDLLATITLSLSPISLSMIKTKSTSLIASLILIQIFKMISLALKKTLTLQTSSIELRCAVLSQEINVII